MAGLVGRGPPGDAVTSGRESRDSDDGIGRCHRLGICNSLQVRAEIAQTSCVKRRPLVARVSIDSIRWQPQIGRSPSCGDPPLLKSSIELRQSRDARTCGHRAGNGEPELSGLEDAHIETWNMLRDSARSNAATKENLVAPTAAEHARVAISMQSRDSGRLQAANMSFACRATNRRIERPAEISKFGLWYRRHSSPGRSLDDGTPRAHRRRTMRA
ncbi:hypothetical protein OH76DRAFT_1491005 [Lentinus brumalis]|uniref:Uncharacterized protein n=1 Tax=Lentinus brumalis TaxID=2498619 RepID=A0A371CH13_9APHY|nr:hypothetical protein OH76DRAFT_1491005 [Polyporus brumalis]